VHCVELSQTAKIILKSENAGKADPLLANHQSSEDIQVNNSIATIVDAIAEGAQAFLWKEYSYLAIFVAVFSIIVLVAVGTAPAIKGVITPGWSDAALTMV
jgi:Na+/H+-translocating membrane pyrophosphatase